jgi:putative membrane protein
MRFLADAAVLVIALLHVWIMVLEMFLWTKPFGRRAFGLTAELAASTKSLAANQGLYNGFLAAGLFWALATHDRSIALFFLGCVFVAGVFGAATAKRSILFVQAIPAAIAIALQFV